MNIFFALFLPYYYAIIKNIVIFGVFYFYKLK